jgi:hypothetical protein
MTISTTAQPRENRFGSSNPTAALDPSNKSSSDFGSQTQMHVDPGTATAACAL